jgi:aryl-alcohol dehydrogenase-like predicted oxidoreductase
MRFVEVEGLGQVSKVGLGTWQFGSREWGYGGRYAEVEAGAIVHCAIAHGVTLFDTAEIYGFGRSERILGRALAADRERSLVATKLFPLLPIAPVVEQRAVASAGRLGVRRIDLYQVHQPNAIVSDVHTMKGMRVLQDVGLVGAVGVSNYSLARWQRAERALGRPVVCNQVRYNLVHRGPEMDLIPYASSRNLLVIAHSPLAQGLLSARYDARHRPRNAVRRRARLFRPAALERAAELFGVLQDVALAHGATAAQIALAWTIRHPSVVAIAGASSVNQVEANAAAADLTLTDGDVLALERAAERVSRPVPD